MQRLRRLRLLLALVVAAAADDAEGIPHLPSTTRQPFRSLAVPCNLNGDTVETAITAD
jgi:hypothetical protein